MPAGEKVAGIDRDVLERYLSLLFEPGLEIVEMKALGVPGNDEVKRYGYGTAVEVDYKIDGQLRRAVFQTVRPGPHGHETMPDRAGLLLSNHETFSRLPKHAHAFDVGVIDRSGALHSLGEAEEFFILTEHVPGVGYERDFFRMRDTGEATAGDFSRARDLCDYLVEIHAVRRDDPGLYLRRIRELVGHGECIMGLNDSYPDRHGFIDRTLLEDIEHRVVAWRWKLRDRTDRLRQVHGDFHPWNILFEDDGQFHVLDRSRGEWGEAADDVSCLTMNYLFFSIQREGRLVGGFKELFEEFWSRYLERTRDREMLEVVAPFFAFRGIVVASPVWYPDLDETVRRRIFAFIRNVLDEEAFDPTRVNEYCDA